jgi:hypothetical protein
VDLGRSTVWAIPLNRHSRAVTIDPGVVADLSRTVDLVLDDSSDPQNETVRWITDFRATNPTFVCLSYLLHYFSSPKIAGRFRGCDPPSQGSL